MSALACNFGHIRGLLTDLAAVLAVFLAKASTDGMRTFGRRFKTHVFPPNELNSGAPTLQQVSQ